MKILNKYTNNEIDNLIELLQSDIEKTSYDLKIPRSFVEKQYKLHLLQFDQTEILENSSALNFIIADRLSAYKSDFDKYTSRANLTAISNNSKIKKNSIVNETDKRVDYVFKAVPNSTAKFIEDRLHYLFSYRQDSIFRFGLFLKNSKYPFCYISLTPISRYYRSYCVSQYVGKEIPKSKILNLARVYGYGALPKNSISKLISFSTKQLKQEGFEYCTTSVNPFLGFDGKSMLGSGFTPIASCPVTYNYINGYYTTKRKSKNRIFQSQKILTPPNVMFLKKIDCSDGQTLKKRKKLFSIDEKLYSQKDVNLDIPMGNEKTIKSLRNDLEKVWNRFTAYHRTDFNDSSNPKSKGQCGVTTAYLAKEFEEDGLDVFFCEGDVEFPDGTAPIINHCWIKLKSYNIGRNKLKDLIIDLTSDQTGYKEPVICSPDEFLKTNGIIYKSIKEHRPKDLHNQSLNDRLKMLETKLDVIDGSK